MAKRLKDGDILFIKLPEGLGYTYAKYFNLQKLPIESTYPDMIQAYDLRTKDLCTNIEEIESHDFLVQPMLVAGMNVVLRNEYWGIIGSSKDTTEFFTPHFKAYGPPTVLDERDASEWYFIEDLNLGNKIKSTYEKVSHLEDFAGLGTGNIEIRLAIYLLTSESIDITTYFDLNNERYSWQYKKVNEIPLISSMQSKYVGRAK